jgi:polyisoprenyl-phosphate glycosyltransferase
MIEIIVPCFNEEDNILILQKEVSDVLSEVDYRIIFIDDGSSDNSWDNISKLTVLNDNITGIKLSRNFGHQAAIDAGLQNSEGEAVILMDGDLQDDPSYLKDLIKKWDDGFDIVLAKRIKRKENFLRKFYIGIFFRLQSYLSEINIPANVGHFSLMDKVVVNEINNFDEKIKYFNGLRAYVGFNIGSIEVIKSKRRNGKPKMTYRKLLFLGIQGIFGFSSKPLTFIAILGFIISFGSLIISAYAFYYKVRFGSTILGWDFGLSSIYFLSGIQLFALSIIGKYVGSIFLEVKKRPSYIIREKI